MQVDEGGQRHARRADLHLRAGDGIQHPRLHGRYDARRRLDMDQLTRSPALAVVSAYPMSVKRMPAIVDLDFLPDMGRMTPRWG